MANQNLVEAYKKRIQVAESVYGKTHLGEKMDNARKITLARCLKNTQDFLNEAFDASSATQRADLGLYKK